MAAMAAARAVQQAHTPTAVAAPLAPALGARRRGSSAAPRTVSGSTCDTALPGMTTTSGGRLEFMSVRGQWQVGLALREGLEGGQMR